MVNAFKAALETRERGSSSADCPRLWERGCYFVHTASSKTLVNYARKCEQQTIFYRCSQFYNAAGVISNICRLYHFRCKGLDYKASDIILETARDSMLSASILLQIFSNISSFRVYKCYNMLITGSESLAVYLMDRSHLFAGSAPFLGFSMTHTFQDFRNCIYCGTNSDYIYIHIFSCLNRS